MKTMRAVLGWTGCALAACLACGDGGTGPGTDVATLTVVPLADTLEVGATLTARVEARDPVGRAITPTLTWTSSDPAVADVSEAGVVTGIGPGTAVILVSATADAQARLDVTVLGAAVSLDLLPDTAVLVVGDSLRLEAIARDAAGASRPVPDGFTLATLDPAVVTVTGDVVHAVGRGTGRVVGMAGALTDTTVVTVDSLVNPGVTLVASPTVSGRPYDVAVSPTGLILVARLDAAAVSVDSIGGAYAFGSEVSVGFIPTAVAFSPDGSRAYTADQGGSVTVINTATRAATTSVPIQGSAFHVRTDSTGLLWVGNNQGYVYRIDPNTFVKDSVDVGDHVNGIAFAVDRVFAADPASGTISSINPATLALSQVVVGGRPQGIAARNGVLYVARENDDVIRLDAASGAVLGTYPAPGGFGLAVTPDGSELWVMRFGAGFTIVRLADGSVTDVTPGGDLRRVAFSPLGDIAVITDQDNRVLVYR